MNITSNSNSLQTNQSFLNTTAKSIESGSQNLSKDMTNLITAENTNAVNINAIKTQDEMLGSLLDIKA
jgi:flagellar hook protein FlgE